MHPYLTEQMAAQHDADLRDVRHRTAIPAALHTPVRRRAGWALVSLGLRLAYATGEE